MLKIFLALALFYMSLVQASPFNDLTDQFDKSWVKDQPIKYILFTADMEAYKQLKATFEQKKINQEFLVKNQIGVLADTSKMPKLVAKLFAIPKMKQLPYSIYLDQTGQITADWKREPATISVLLQDSNSWKLYKFLKNSDELKSWLSSGFDLVEQK